jgi:HSP20 family protein
MHRLIKIRLMRDTDRLEDQLRRWRDQWLEPPRTAAWRPAVDLCDTAAGLVLRLEVPGVAEQDLSITLAGQELVIRGQRRSLRPDGLIRYLQHEILQGVFERSFLLPVPVDADNIKAHCVNGILEIHLPRQVPAHRRIPVKDDNQESV